MPPKARKGKAAEEPAPAKGKQPKKGRRGGSDSEEEPTPPPAKLKGGPARRGAAESSSEEEDDGRRGRKKQPPKPAPKKGKAKVSSESEDSERADKRKAKPKAAARKSKEATSSDDSDAGDKKKAKPKAAARKGKVESSSEDSEPKGKAKPKAAARKDKAESSSEEEDSEEEARPKPPPKRAPKKPAAKQESSSEGEESSDEAPAPKPKAKAPAKAAAPPSSDDSSSEGPAPKPKPKPRAAPAKDESSDEDSDAEPKAQPKPKAKPSRAPPSDEDDEDEEEESGGEGTNGKGASKGKGKGWYNSDEEKGDGAHDVDMKGLTRKARKKMEKKIKQQETYDLEVAAKENESPFTVQVPADAYVSMADNIRNIIISGVSVHVRGVELFRNVDVKFIAGRRYGLVGPNGKGKSTLLRLLDSREIPMPKNLHVLMVSQEQEVEAMDEPAVKVVIESDTRRLELMREAEKLQKEVSEDAVLRQRQVEEELIAIDAFRAESRARRILTGLGFPHEWHERPTRSFSGGWRKRIALACAVFMEPDFLMLDEPTNHLDLNAVIWLETYLPIMYREEGRKKPKTLIVVSHDVSFLDNVCTDTVHIDMMRLMYYKGNYEAFMEGRGQQEAEHDKLFNKQQNQIKTWKKQGLSKKQVEEKLKTLAQRDGKSLADVVLEKRRDYVVNFPFPEPPELREAHIVKMTDASFHYPNCEDLFQDLNLAIWTDSRITLCGPNGIGKTTLLNLMAGLLEPTAGHVERNHLVRIARYSQHFVDSVPLDRTGVEYLQQQGLQDEFKCRQRLGNFGLESVRHLEKIGNLSGGQKARVAFAGLSVLTPHLLLLDEPTNHLDMESIAALADALNKFKGGVLLVTHDARLIKQTVNQIWVMGNKTVDTHSFSNFDDYKEHLVEQMELAELQKEEEKEEREQEKVLKAAQRVRAKEEEKVEKRRKAKEAAPPEPDEPSAKKPDPAPTEEAEPKPAVKAKLDKLFTKKEKKKP